MDFINWTPGIVNDLDEILNSYQVCVSVCVSGRLLLCLPKKISVFFLFLRDFVEFLEVYDIYPCSAKHTWIFGVILFHFRRKIH